MMQGLAGWMSLTGDPDGPPTKSGLSLVDLSGGYVSAIAVLAGLWRARRDGVGCDCDVSLFDTALHELMYVGTWAASRGYVPPRRRNSAHPSIVPFQNFETADGWIVVACPKEKFWTLLCDAIERPELAEEFPTFADRDRRRDELSPILDEVFRGADERGVAGGARRGGRPVLAGERRGRSARGGAAASSTSIRGSAPFGRSRRRCGCPAPEPPARPAPARGEHTEQVLVEVCGYRAGADSRAGRVGGVRSRVERRSRCRGKRCNLRGWRYRSRPTRRWWCLATRCTRPARSATTRREPGRGRHRRADAADARERPDVPRRGGLHAGRRRQGERVPRRPRRLPGLQRGLCRVLLEPVPRADVGPGGVAARRADRDRGGGAAVRDRARPRRLRRVAAGSAAGRAARGSRSASCSTTRRAASVRCSRATPESESYLHEVVGAPPAVGRRNLNTESMFEFGSRVGFWRVHRIFTAHGLPLTVYAVGRALEQNPAAARAMVDAGWEVASHGWRWFDYAGLSEDEEREHMRLAIEAIERAVRHPPGRLVHRAQHGEHAPARGRGGRASSTTRTPTPTSSRTGSRSAAGTTS